jgi:hypothetical protein
VCFIIDTESLPQLHHKIALLLFPLIIIMTQFELQNPIEETVNIGISHTQGDLTVSYRCQVVLNIAVEPVGQTLLTPE